MLRNPSPSLDRLYPHVLQHPGGGELPKNKQDPERKGFKRRGKGGARVQRKEVVPGHATPAEAGVSGAAAKEWHT